MTIDYNYAVCVKHKHLGFEAQLIKRRDGKPDYWICSYGHHEIHPATGDDPATLLALVRKGTEDV